MNDNNDDPLAVLEDILQDAEAKKGGGNVKGPSVTQRPSAGDSQPTPEEIAQKEAEKERQRQADEAERQQLEAERLAQIAEQKQQIEQEVMHSPEHQAAVQQDEAKQQADEDASTANEGFEIRQLDHDKI